jgi:hypothetical protein
MPSHLMSAASGLALLLAAASAPAAGPAPPDVARTVGAFAGTWKLQAVQVLPDGTRETGPLAFECKKTGLGKGVACTGRGTLPRSGDWEGSFLVAYDTFSRKVHFMGVTSDESVHDHVCAWKDDSSLACDPLKGGAGGQPITEDLGFTFAQGTMTMKVVVTLAGGGRVLFDASGKRR